MSDSTFMYVFVGLSVAIMLVAALIFFLMARSEKWAPTDLIQRFLTFLLVAVTLVLVFGVFLKVFGTVATDANFKNALAIAGPILAAFGTLIGFVAGQAAGADGRDKLIDKNNEANENALNSMRSVAYDAMVASGLADPDKFMAAVNTGRFARPPDPTTESTS